MRPSDPSARAARAAEILNRRVRRGLRRGRVLAWREELRRFYEEERRRHEERERVWGMWGMPFVPPRWAVR